VRTFDEICSLLQDVLSGPVRRSIAADAAKAGDLGKAMLRLRDGMRTNVWKIGAQPFDIARIVQKYDRKTRQNGFHVLHDWDGIADKVNDDTIPVDVLHYVAARRGSDPVDQNVIAILLDYYFLHVLALLSLRIWDEGDADANLDRLELLLRNLQGPDGAGQQFAADGETLILIGTSHFELHERGYGALLEKTRTLNRAHQARIALGHAASMGSHLRFGFEATYGRDTVNMRDDNVADYPWLCFALATLMKEYTCIRQAGASRLDRERVVEAMLNGLAADARAFVGAPPASLAACEAERREFRESFLAFRDDLLAEFEPHRPSDQTYSPLCFFFNFSHNVVKGVVIDALLRGERWTLSLNDLLTRFEDGNSAKGAEGAEGAGGAEGAVGAEGAGGAGGAGGAQGAAGAAGAERAESSDKSSESKLQLTYTLMGYARDNPHRIRGRLRPVIVYDWQSGREAFAVAMRKLRE
jgi:hypothetical protein